MIVNEVVRNIESSALDSAMRQAVVAELDFRMPLITLRTEHELVEPLTRLGMRSAFEARTADFVNLIAPPYRAATSQHVSGAFQVTFLQVDEERTEAAAVTGIGVTVTSVPPPPRPFIVNRPYVIIIRDDATRSILFIALIRRPEQDG